jgi:hypothetical protein
MEKLNLSELALAAEVLGGVAVVVTLVFLVLATRENTNAIQAQTYQALTSELNALRFTSATSEMSDIFVRISTEGIDALSNAERMRLQFSAEAKWGVYENAFFSRNRGVLGEDEWSRFASAICRNFTIDQWLWGSNDTQWGSLSRNVTPAFRDYVESACQ